VTKPKRILIADDDPRVLLILRTALERMNKGYRIATAQDGVEALVKARDGSFDLVISDVRMPGLDGVELAQAIRAFDVDIAIVWITAYGCLGLQAESERLGIYRCLDKPLRIDEIRQAARKALGEPVGSSRTDEHGGTEDGTTE
jgi:two-component system response regulator GlrR